MRVKSYLVCTEQIVQFESIFIIYGITDDNFISNWT